MAQVINPIYYLANRAGIPRVESTSVSVSTTGVTYTFNSDISFAKNFSGLVLVKINQAVPSDTTTTLPVYFSSTTDGAKEVQTYGGTALTVADLKDTGIYLTYYENGTVQML